MSFLQSIGSLFSLIRKGMSTQVWSIKVFSSTDIISKSLLEINMETPSLQASDVKDIQAEFVADPFIIKHDSQFFMFFEALNKGTGRGEIAVARSLNGEKWNYQSVVLREDFHLSYPQVFKVNDEIFMLPETSEIKQVLLYKATKFPFQWEVSQELFSGHFLDPSIFRHEGKWWILAGSAEGNLHLFYSEKLKGAWNEHPKSPMITNDKSITRPGGRIIVSGGHIYRYTQDCYPEYGNSVRVFKVKNITELEYEEEEISLILSGTKKKDDWRKDGMHHIDQLMIDDNQWLIAVDGHRTQKSSYFAWKFERVITKIFSWKY